MKIILADFNADLIDAWKIEFEGYKNVEIQCDSIFNYPADAMVSPANSFGFMDGGLDYSISMVLGWHVQERLREMIDELPEKELLVGKVLTLPTLSERWPYLISAPTMRVPMILGSNSVNVYLASLAIFNELLSNPNISSIVVSGLGTGVGKVPPRICAHQMRQAYDHVFINYSEPKTWQEAQSRHLALCKEPPRDLQQIGNV
jgi:O-acetyl-ADP-ribose deacetylase (regulator of RNase III)